MEQEPSLRGEHFDSVATFRELFELLNEEGAGKEYQEAYDEAVTIARTLVSTKGKQSWDAAEFETEMQEKHPGLSGSFVAALSRCIERYNPPVNLSNESPW